MEFSIFGASGNHNRTVTSKKKLGLLPSDSQMSVTDNGAYSVCSDLGSVNLQYRSELRFIYAEFRSSYQVYKMKLEPELPRLISSHWKLW